NEIVIPYKKYVLPNGLVVIIHEDHSDPVVYVDVTYHVGSAREQEGRSGFAHFFEHMMFQGSKHVGDEMHFKYVAEAGGELNGSTNADRTNYFETVPSNQLETMLWLESDRMGFLLDSVTQKKFEVQRSTVKNERGQRYDNAPYGVMGEKTSEVFYPKAHPYSWQTIGYIEDLDRVDVNDLKRFYMRWYGPNNAALTISGDVNAEQTLKLVEKYFGSIPKGPAVKKQIVKPFTIDKDRYISYEDKVKFPALKMAWQGVERGSKDESAMEALASILTPNNLSSPFYEKMIKTQKAVGIFIFSQSQELGGKFEINLRAPEGTSLAEMEKEIRAILTEWEKTGVTDDDIAKLKAGTQSQVFDQITTVQGKGARLAAYQTFKSNPNQIGNEIGKILKLKKEDIMTAYNKYIKNKACVIMSCVPLGKKELIATADNSEKPGRTIQTESAEYKNLSYTEPKDNFDRGIKPPHGANPVVHVPDFWAQNFDNGIKLIGTTSKEIPKVTIQIIIGAGHRYELPEKAGEANLLARLMDESTTAHSVEEIENLLDRMGSTISINAGNQELSVYITTLTTNLDATLKLAEEKLFKPKWDPEEFERVKKELLNAIKNQSVQPTAIAENVYAKLLYGKGHIMSLPASGTAETVASITLEELKNFYNTQFSPSVSKIVVVGDVGKDELIPKLKFLSDWKNKKIVKMPDPETPKIEKTKIYFVDKKGAAQSEIRIGYMAMAYDPTGDFYKAGVMNYIFAGNFNSRINLQLRELRGYTYGTGGGFTGGVFAGPYTINGGIRANATDTAIMDYMTQMKLYLDKGISEEELVFTKAAIGQSEALKFEAPQQKAGFIKRILDYNLPKDYTHQQNELLATFTKEQINELAKKYLPINNLNIVVVGDKATLFERIKNLGYEVVELDINGDKVN
ncbi:MAG: insulinase family protein, partial [Bacteroidia bacterium]|nr:insulinase family protein [Bacteroidia bacterium]